MAGSSSAVSSSTLICKEHRSHLDLEHEDGDEENETRVLSNELLLLEADDEYIGLLLSRESGYDNSTRAEENSCNSDRSDAIRWILETKDASGFSLETAYTAMTYFDRFFAHRTIDIMKDRTWAVKLLSVACLSLAAKMEERELPALSEFRVKDYRFSSEAIQRMEFFALSALGWRMHAVTPFPYLNIFASKFEGNGSKDLIAKAIKHIFATVEVMNLVDFRPSVVAAAAILAALDERLTQKLVESKISLISFCGSFDTEHVFSCYSLMVQESHKEEKLKASKNLALSYTSPGNCVSTIATNCTASFTMRSSKRRRLQ